MTFPERSPSRGKARALWIAALLLGSGLLLLTAPAWASDGFFEGPHTDEGWDTDADNRFEFLVVNVTVNVTVGGDFTVEAKLYDSPLGATLITNNSTAFSGGVGLHVVSINLEGRDIFGSRIDGPYRVTLDLLNDTMVLVDGDVHITAAYSHVEFGPIFAFTPPHTDVGLDTDGNGQFNFIQVNLSANTSLPGFFFIFGAIYSSGVIDFKIRLLNLTAGDHIIPFNFSGIGAFLNGDDGPYAVLVSASVIECGRDTSGEGDSSNHTTAAYFFTDFEFGIKRDLTGSVTNGTTGQPVADETVWLANQTHRWLVSFQTDAAGNFSVVAFEGDFILLAEADGLQDEALPLTIEGDTNVDVTLFEEDVEASEVDLTLTDWGNVTVHIDMYGYADNQSQRFLVDQFAGNGDLFVDADESDQWIEIFRSCFRPFNDTSGQFEVDGIPFLLDDGTFVMDADLTGPITSMAPTLTTQDMNFTSQSPIASLATHEVFLRANYDNENETEEMTLHFPSAWVLDSFWPVNNVTVGPLNYNTIIVDPLGRPSGDPPSVDVVMNATLDATPPAMSNVSDAPDPQEVFGSVTLSATVTDNSGVALVSVNITDPSGGTACNCSLAKQAGSDDYTYAASFGLLGVYNYTIWAEDDAGLFTSASGSFTIHDTTPPSVGVPSASPNPQEAGMTVDFAAVVSDNFQVDAVTIAIVDPDPAPVGNFTMTFVGGEWNYARIFTKLGLYTMTVWANDTSGNLASNGGSFTIVDSNAPQIHNTSATPDPQEVFSSVTIFANISDNSGIKEVRVHITDPGASTVGNFTMTDLGGGQYMYAAAYGALGTFGHTVWAEDDGGLFSSASGTFTIQDTTLPTFVGEPSASPNPQEAGQTVNLSAAVSDNFAVDTVTVAIRDPADALLGNFTMASGATYTYADTFTDTGTYTYTVWASDTSGNIASGGGQFTVQDTTPPQVTAASAAPDPQEVNLDITLTADVADDGGIASISVRIEDASGALVGNFTMGAVDTDTYAYTLALSDLGVYNFTVWVTDGAGLVGSRSGNFTIQDATAPSIGLPTADPDPAEIGQGVAFSVQVTENHELATVAISIEDPDANPVSNVSMTLVGGAYTHSDSFDEPGTYDYTIWATDTSGNLASRSGTFTVQDSEAPMAVVSGPAEVDIGQAFSLDAGGSTDNHGIANYSWDLGDGTLAYGATVTHAYGEAGDYTVTLTVRDASGNEDSATLALAVLAPAPDGGFLSDTALYGLLAALAAAGITAGVLYWRRSARAAGPKKPPTPPEGGAREEPPKKVAKGTTEELPEPELDALDKEIEDLLKP